MVELGRVTSIEHNHEEKKEAKKGDEICIKIQQPTGKAPVYYGRHFDYKDAVMSKVALYQTLSPQYSPRLAC
jgi:translation initiation factor 5B